MANEVTRQGSGRQEVSRISNSEIFANEVFSVFTGGGRIALTERQKQLIYGYGIQIDQALALAELNRLEKNRKNRDHERYDNPDPINWRTIDARALAQKMVHYAQMGIDMAQKNFLFAIPYKDNSRTAPTGTKMYNVTLMMGYNGIRYIAEKYAQVPPKSITVELVYSTDTFRPFKKGRNNPCDSYELEIGNPFDRGKVVGGFGYIEYADPARNKLIIMSKREIDKRKPKYASGNFWSEGDDGWYEAMALKTLTRAVCDPKNIPIDPEAAGRSWQNIQAEEVYAAEMEAMEAAEESAASVPLRIDGGGMGDAAAEQAEIPEKAWVPEGNPAGQAEALPARERQQDADGSARAAAPEPMQEELADQDYGQMAMPGF